MGNYITNGARYVGFVSDLRSTETEQKIILSYDQRLLRVVSLGFKVKALM